MPTLNADDMSGLETKALNTDRWDSSDPDVIVIEDDNIASNRAVANLIHCDEDLDSDGGSLEVWSSFYKENDQQYVDDSRDAASELSDSFDEDDCYVVEPGPSVSYWHSHRLYGMADKRPTVSSSYSEGDTRSESDSPDCEIIEDPYGILGQYLEGPADQSERSKGTSNNATKNIAKGYCRKVKMESSVLQDEFQGIVAPVSEDTCQDSHTACSDVKLGMVENTENSFLFEKALGTSDEGAVPVDDAMCRLSSNSAGLGPSSGESALGKTLKEESGPDASQNAGTLVNDALQQPKTSDETDPIFQGDLLKDRERLKQTEEFKRADEEEWARRQLELQRQAQEAQRLRKRNKAEAVRKLEMERRQRQRLEEVRQSQQNEENNTNYKELVRGKIWKELEHIASTCIDMATLLRHLGVQVDGGAFPTTQQVNTAYKKAMLRFHPDRVVAVAQMDPFHQVEAEEIFKLISRLKNTLQPFAIGYFNGG